MGIGIRFSHNQQPFTQIARVLCPLFLTLNFIHTKHMDIKFHFLQEHVVLHSIEIQHIPSQQQIDDILTKALIPDQFRHLQELVMLTTWY